MTNTFKKSLLFIATSLLATNLFAQKTYTFDDGVALETDWTITKDVPSGGTGDCAIATDQFSAKSGNFLLLSFLNKSKITITITSTASYNNISNIKFDAIANDNSKPSWTLNIVDDNGNIVKNVYSDYGTKTNFNTSGSNKWGVSNSAINPAASGHIQLVLYASSSGKYAAIDNLEVTYQAGPVISTDATLSALTYNGTSVPNFSATTTNYEVELPAGTTTPPTVAATKNDTKASDPVITQATSLPGNATVTVTAEDGTTTKTYTITFTVASSAPKVTSANWSNIKGTATIDQVNKTITGQVTNGSSLTITPQFTGDNINSWTPNTAQNFANGAVNYTFKSTTNETTVYAVTITEAPAVSTDATLSSLKYGSTSVPNFSANTLTYNIELTAGTKTPPTISATANESHATVAITQASSVPGVGKVEVTAEDGETKLTYTINYTVALPFSDLTTHVPEIYEAKELAGGYNGTLSTFNSREYEVYYATFDANSHYRVAVTPVQKTDGFTVAGNSDYECKAKDGWLEVKGATSKSNYSGAKTDEFEAGDYGQHKIYNDGYYKLRISGYDQFSFFARDNNADASKGKYFKVFIDDVEQPTNQLSTNDKIRRYDISTGEHIIEVRGVGGSNNYFYGFSLRLAQEPRTKRVKGNDSTQVVNQTASITPITYATKYNNIPNAETRLIWDGPEAKGISLPEEPLHGGLSDTLILSGQANCQIGEYKYHIAAYYNGVEINRVSGKFIVKSSIAARSELDALAYTGEEMDQIIFSYYALSPDSVRLNWPNGQPAGISGSGNNGRYIIGGTPTATSGTYPYSITTAGGDTTFTGTISVITPNYGPKSVMYLCKNAKDYSKDAIYQTLNGTGSNQWDLFPRKQKENGPRPTEQYANYKWILISEDADADNLEVLSIIQGGANLPVLSMKGFTYAQGRLGWGEPNNGAIDTTLNTKNKGTKLYIEQPSHPIFAQLGSSLKKGDSIQILSNYELNGIMPVDVKLPGTYCLATAYTRDINDYYKNGELQTALHEVPANMRGGQKYICLPLAKGVTFTPQGKNLLNGIISYLLSPDQATVETPELQINSFELLGVKATINQSENTISLALTEEQSAQLEGAEPTIKIADEANTHVTTSAVPLQYALYTPKIYVVTDYINRRAYSLTIDVYDPEGIENVYEAGKWVNIFDIYGRKVATTNENIYTMDLPRGMYIIVTESGETLKIMR